MNRPDADANVIYFLRALKKLGLLSHNTYIYLGEYLIVNGKNKKDAWRKANWKEFLKSG
jgi:hypothetical protein